MKRILAILTLCMLVVAGYAQNQQISGVVVDEQGEPVIGASVQATGTTVGTITDYDGNFTLSVPADAKTVTITYVGMKPMEVAIQKNMHVVLKENTEVIQEVVVTGYGNVSKVSYAGSVAAVDAEAIEKKSPSEISKALAGEAAGVQVVNSTGQPGSNASIRIRGIGSVYASTSPLYVVDGVTYDGDISSIDPGDIAATTILKDAAATALYGSRGANGVIVITTKKGTSGETGKIDVDVKYGANMHILPMYDVITDPQEFVLMAWQSIYNTQTSHRAETKIQNTNNDLFSAKGLPVTYNLWNLDGNQLIDGNAVLDGGQPKFYSDAKMLDAYQHMTPWKESIFRVGQKAEASVRISGGTDKATYYTAFSYLKDEGYYIGSDFDRFSVRSNIEHNAKKWLKGSLNISYTYSKMNAAGQGSNMNNGFAFVNEIPPIYPVFLYDINGNILTDPKTGGYAYDYGMSEGSGRSYGTGINPAGSLLYDRDNLIQHQVSAVGSLEFKLYKGLKFIANVGTQYVGATSTEHTNAFYGDAAGIGRITKQQTNYISLTAQQQLSYMNSIGNHDFSAMAIHETNFVRSSGIAGSMMRLAASTGDAVLEFGNYAKMSGMNSSTTEQALESYILQGTYTYNNRYYISGIYRADGSSKFAKGHRWGHFGSVGFSWMFTNEDFMQSQHVLKDGKLRINWGINGNQGVSNFLYEDQYSVQYVDGEIGYVWGYKGYQDLTWERLQQVDLGAEFSIMKYLDVELDYFYRYTDHMLMPRYVASSQGFSYTWVNGGSMENQGVEFQFKVHALDTRNVKLDIRLNGGHYHNSVLSLPKFADTDNEDMIMNGSLTIGKSLYDYRMVEYLGVDAESGQALYKGYYDAKLGAFGSTSAETLRDQGMNKANYISNVYLYRENHPDADIQTIETTEYSLAGADYIGKSAEPGLDGGIGLDFEAYGVTLSISTSYRLGGWGYDSQYATLMHSGKVGSCNWHVDMRNAWTAQMSEEEKANATIPRLSNGTDLYANSGSTRFLISNSYFSLNNVHLGYTFPKKLIEKIKLNRLELYVSADNLAIASARKGYNPMTSFTGSSSTYQYTPLSTIMGGIKFQF